MCTVHTYLSARDVLQVDQLQLRLILMMNLDKMMSVMILQSKCCLYSFNKLDFKGLYREAFDISRLLLMLHYLPMALDQQ